MNSPDLHLPWLMSAPLDTILRIYDRDGILLNGWPENAIEEYRNPMLIEQFIVHRVQDSQVTLLGEIDFDFVEDYGNTHWSLRQLAKFTFNTPAVKQTLTKWTTGKCYYPGIIATWAVAQAQNLDDGSELWTTANLETTTTTHLASAFSEAIGILGLETFEDHLNGMQKHMTLARLHAIIPTYALEKYSIYIRRGVDYHRSAASLMAEMIEAHDLSRSVRKLFQERPELGLDLVERSIQTVRYQESAGLPPRLTYSLISSEAQRNTLRPQRDVTPPVVSLDQSTGELYLRGHGGWRFIAPSDSNVDAERLSCETFYGIKDSEEFAVMDISDGYLLFDSHLEMIDRRVLSSNGGYILFNTSTQVDRKCLQSEEVPFASWPGWKYAMLEPDMRLQITLSTGAIRSLSPRQSLNVSENRVPWLSTRNRHQIFNASPVLQEGQRATAINQLNGSRRALGPQADPISDIEWGAFDVTAYAGLGKYKNFRGLIIPGLNLNGDKTPLVLGESRRYTVDIAKNWTGDSEIEITYSLTDPIPFFTLIDPAGIAYELFIDMPKLNWSIKFKDPLPEPLIEESTYDISRLKEAERLVLHGLGDQIPRLLIKDGEKQIVLNGTPRHQDCLYDLRPIQGGHLSKEIKFVIIQNGKQMSLARFLRKQQKPRILRITDLHDLTIEATVQAGLFTDEQWGEFALSRARNRDLLKKSLRGR